MYDLYQSDNFVIVICKKQQQSIQLKLLFNTEATITSFRKFIYTFFSIRKNTKSYFPIIDRKLHFLVVVIQNGNIRFSKTIQDKLVFISSSFHCLGPTPDWVVGVNGLNLCLKNCTWIENLTVDLYPYDAGTDSGITYMVRASRYFVINCHFCP